MAVRGGEFVIIGGNLKLKMGELGQDVRAKSCVCVVVMLSYCRYLAEVFHVPVKLHPN